MSEEMKNLTEDERKELKENLKKQIDELSDEELNNIVGGNDYNSTLEEINENWKTALYLGQILGLARNGVCPICNQKVNLVGDYDERFEMAQEQIKSGCKSHI